MRAAFPALFLSCVLLAPAAAAPDPGEFRALTREADAWVELGEWCLEEGLGAQARECVRFAFESMDEAQGLAQLRERAAAAEGDEPQQGKWVKRRAAQAKKTAKLFDKLHPLALNTRDRNERYRYAVYAAVAIELEPNKKRWGRAIKTAQGLFRIHPPAAMALVERLVRLEPEGKTLKKVQLLLDEGAKSAPLMRTASKHPMRYMLSLPRSYKRGKGKKWPVLICIEGAGSTFDIMMEHFQEARGDEEVILIVPATFANTVEIGDEERGIYGPLYTPEIIDRMATAGLAAQLEFDTAGVLSIIEDVAKEYEAEERSYIYGFSGGGKLTFSMAFQHPDKLNGCIPTCAVFTNRGFSSLKGKFSGDDLAIPIYQIEGAKDPHRVHIFGNPANAGLEEMGVAAQRIFRDLGYTNLKREIVEGMDHVMNAPRVFEHMRPWFRGQKQRTDPWN